MKKIFVTNLRRFDDDDDEWFEDYVTDEDMYDFEW